MLITFESGECGGKDTQIKLLEDRLKSFNPNYKILSAIQEPGSTLKAEVLRMILKNKQDTEFNFPGDFIKTFDFKKYKKFFEEEELPKNAKKYLTEALKIMKSGIKYETIIFLFTNSLLKNGLLEKTINKLNEQKENAPADVLLSTYFSKEILMPEEQLCILMAARNMLYHNTIIPALNNYDFILLNRSKDSSTVYQGWAQKVELIKSIRELNLEATQGVVPDLTILLDLPIEEIEKRKFSRKTQKNDLEITKDFFDEKHITFHEKVRNGYLKEVEYYDSLPKNNPEYARIKKVDAFGSIEEVHNRIWLIVYEKIKTKSNKF